VRGIVIVAAVAVDTARVTERRRPRFTGSGRPDASGGGVADAEGPDAGNGRAGTPAAIRSQEEDA